MQKCLPRTNMPKTLNPTPIADIKYCFPWIRSTKPKPDAAPLTNSPSSTSSSMPKQSTASTRNDQLREVFRCLNRNRDGKICAPELQAFFESIGEYISCQEAEAVIREADTDGDNMLCFAEFVRLMQSDDGGSSGSLKKEEEMRRAFEMFESDKGSGRITPAGLQRMLHKLGDVKSYDECASMIRVFDIDGDGMLDFQDFQGMLMA